VRKTGPSFPFGKCERRQVFGDPFGEAKQVVSFFTGFIGRFHRNMKYQFVLLVGVGVLKVFM